MCLLNVFFFLHKEGEFIHIHNGQLCSTDRVPFIVLPLIFSNYLSFNSPVYRKHVALSMYLYVGSSKIRGNRLLKNETCISFMVFCIFYFVY